MFTLALDAAGNHTFTLDKPLDHAAAGADAIALNFGVTVTDKDGDAAMGTITVNIVDDVPVAHDDVNGFTTHVGNTVIGNVITGANEQAGGADTLSKDAPDTVTQVGFSNGAGPGIVAAMTNGSATINVCEWRADALMPMARIPIKLPIRAAVTASSIRCRTADWRHQHGDADPDRHRDHPVR